MSINVLSPSGLCYYELHDTIDTCTVLGTLNIVGVTFESKVVQKKAVSEKKGHNV